MANSGVEMRRLPGEIDGTLGKAASYSPTQGTDDSLDSVFLTPSVSSQSVSTKPVMLNYRQTGGRSPDEPQAAPRPDLGQMQRGKVSGKDWWTKPKLVMAGIAVIIILLLTIVLPIALTLSKNRTDDVAALNATAEASVGDARLSEQPPIVVVVGEEEGSGGLPSEPVSDDEILDDDEFIISTDIHLTPPPVAICSDEGFLCSEDGSRIGQQQECDGVSQCPRGSDETNCTMCQTSLWCDEGGEGRKKCLRAERLCDTIPDCLDATDETRFCGLAECGDGHYRCQGEGISICVPEAWRCDGDAHCPFGDDEAECEAETCIQGASWCAADARCIPAWSSCDGRRDCSDGSDEVACDCTACRGPDSVLCEGANGTCIARGQLCDGFNDCPGAEDEINCPGWCPQDATPARKLCSDGVVYPLRYACSGLVEACESVCESCDPEMAFTCGGSNGPKCIPRRHICDGIAQCGDASDEAASICSCAEDAGPLPPFRCPPTLDEMIFGAGNHTKCLPAYYRCDGFRDCPDGADERNCTKGCANLVLGLDSLHCAATNDCFPSTARCDGVVDCPDYSDEDACSCTECKSQSYSTYMCSQGGRCLKSSYICNPNSPFHCPGDVAFDLAHCSRLFDPLMP